MMDIYVLIIVIIYVALKFSLDILQINFINNHKITNDEIEKLEINAKNYNKARNYNVSKLHLSLVKLLIDASLIYTFLISDGLILLSHYVELSNVFIPNHYELLIIFLTLIYALKMSLTFVSIFYIEEKYGFNNMTKKLFFRDSFVGYIFTIMITIISFYGFELIFYNFNDYWWILFWLSFLLFNFILIIVYPNFIAPIFNDFKKINDKTLIANINDLTNVSKFQIDDIFVMDGSKRSNHSNAYFTGLFSKKRIVFFDTLLKSLNYAEIKSVLAHEIGHYKMKHIQKSLFLSMFLSFIYFYIFYLITQNFNILVDNNFTTLNIGILFIIITPILLFFINPLLSNLSRCNEYEADNYAKEFSDGEALKSSLRKLYKDNFSLVRSSYLYTVFYHTHPTVYERINNLNKRV